MTATPKPQSYALLRLEDIAPGPNARQKFPKAELAELGRSLAAGQAQPIVVRPFPGPVATTTPPYQLVAGERRVRAAAAAGMETIEAVVRDVSDHEAARIRLVENLDRKDLTALEQARAVDMYLQASGATHDLASEMLGHDRSWITNTLLLLKLPKRAKDLLADGTFSAKHGRELVRLQAKAGDECVADLLEAVGWQLDDGNVPTARAFADLVDDEIETWQDEQERDRRDEEALQRDAAALAAKQQVADEVACYADDLAAAKKKGEPLPPRPESLVKAEAAVRASRDAENAAQDAKRAGLSDRERDSREAATRSAQRTRVRKKLIAESVDEYVAAVLERRKQVTFANEDVARIAATHLRLGNTYMHWKPPRRGGLDHQICEELGTVVLPRLPGKWQKGDAGVTVSTSGFVAQDLSAARSWIALVAWLALDTGRLKAQLDKAIDAAIAKREKERKAKPAKPARTGMLQQRVKKKRGKAPESVPTRRCAHEGCGTEFTLRTGPGRKPKYCPVHRST